MKNFPIKGIDVSKYEKEIDWLKVKAQIEFVIIRAGYGLEISQKDIKFEENFESAKKLNIPIGIYWYAHATNESEAEKEAKTCLEIIKNKKFEFPIFYDIESQKIFKQGKENVSKIADKFCSILKENNYLCGIYSSVNFFKNYFNDEIKNKVPLWIAHWTNNDKPNFNGDYGIWQYSSKGKIDGIEGDVDLDYGYVDYEKIIVENHFNGY